MRRIKQPLLAIQLKYLWLYSGKYYPGVCQAAEKLQKLALTDSAARSDPAALTPLSVSPRASRGLEVTAAGGESRLKPDSCSLYKVFIIFIFFLNTCV